MEMHTVHIADNAGLAESSGFGYAAMGIMFSVNEYTADLTESQQLVIDKFFDSMHWTSPQAGKTKDDHHGDDHGDGHRLLAGDAPVANGDDPIADKVNYGELMMMVNMDKRWVYKGSVTTPPCA